MHVDIIELEKLDYMDMKRYSMIMQMKSGSEMSPKLTDIHGASRDNIVNGAQY